MNYSYQGNKKFDINKKTMRSTIFDFDLEDEYNKNLVTYFKTLYKRDVKIWTLESLHDLYLKCKKRNDPRRKATSEHLNKIVNEIPLTKSKYSNRKGSHVVYFNSEDSDDFKVYKMEVSFNEEFQCLTTCRTGYIGEDKGDVVQKRNEQIEFLVSGEVKLEIGNEYQRLNKLSSDIFSNIVYKKINKILCNQLREKFRTKEGKYKCPPSIFTTSIGENKYYIKTDYKSFPSHLDFEMVEYSEHHVDL